MSQWTFDPAGGLSLAAHHLLLNLPHPEFVTADGTLSPTNCESSESHITPEAAAITYHWKLGSRQYLGHASVSRLGQGHVWQMLLSPKDGAPWILSRTTEGSGHLSGWTDTSSLQIFHADNIRGVSQDDFLLNGTYMIPIRDWQRPLNGGRWQCFPGWWIFSENRAGLVSGVLSQNVWRHLTGKGEITADRLSWTGEMIPPGIDARPFAAGESYSSEPIYFELVETLRPAEAFCGYLAALSERLQPCRKNSLLLDGAFWDSWNDRQPHFWDVSTDLVRRTIGTIQDNFPNVCSLEIDDGYAFDGFHEVETDAWTNLEQGDNPVERKTVQKVRRLGAGFAFEPAMALPKDRFPNGVDEASQLISEAGYTPGIWLGLNVVKEANIVRAHPEWFVDYTYRPGDDRELSAVFSTEALNRFHVFDPSMPEARDYLLSVFDILFRQWGFAAFKLDFWSYAFENNGFRLRHSEKTAFEWRRWFFETARRFLPPRTYFVIGCDISTGNPFLCEWVDNVRYGIDIGNGEWNNIVYSALTGTFLLHVEAQRFYLLNSDSIGVLPRLPASEKQCFLAWCAVTRSLCEIAGDLAQKSPDELAILKKLLLAPKNGGGVVFGEYEHLRANHPASILYTPGDLFSRALAPASLPVGVLAIFNWLDETRRYTIDLEGLGVTGSKSYREVNFFSGETLAHSSRQWSVELPPRSVRLSHLSAVRAGTPSILESHWCVRDLHISRDRFQVELHGDSASGFQLYWPFSHPPEVASSTLACEVCQGPLDTFHIRPARPIGLRDWSLSLVIPSPDTIPSGAPVLAYQ
jgi:hypothetical protein